MQNSGGRREYSVVIHPEMTWIIRVSDALLVVPACLLDFVGVTALGAGEAESSPAIRAAVGELAQGLFEVVISPYVTEQVEVPAGEPGTGLSWELVQDKFHAAASLAYGAETRRELVTAMHGLHELPAVSTLISLLASC